MNGLKKYLSNLFMSKIINSIIGAIRVPWGCFNCSTTRRMAGIGLIAQTVIFIILFCLRWDILLSITLPIPQQGQRLTTLLVAFTLWIRAVIKINTFCVETGTSPAPAYLAEEEHNSYPVRNKKSGWQWGRTEPVLPDIYYFVFG